MHTRRQPANLDRNDDDYDYYDKLDDEDHDDNEEEPGEGRHMHKGSIRPPRRGLCSRLSLPISSPFHDFHYYNMIMKIWTKNQTMQYKKVVMGRWAW